ncbi:MAG: hypothetical protein M3173_03335, partial [Chloroflexota bacterium]|nr:hypothetical protein [Chloroflexota bacterium]
MEVEEGQWTVFPSAMTADLVSTRARLRRELRPTTEALVQDGRRFKFQGVVGTVAVGRRSLQIIPKVTEPNADWIGAAVDLLERPDRLAVTDTRRAGLSPRRRTLLEALATLYADRLERALLRDGPMQLLEQRHEVLPALRGKLNVTRWARTAGYTPHRFPVTSQQLNSDNEFTRGLALVARILAGHTTSPVLQRRLRTLALEVRPGAPDLVVVDDAVAHRPLPPQWAVYAPAWSIAVAVLTQRSLVSRVGTQHGVSLVIEAWRLHERMLDRSLAAAAQLGRAGGRPHMRSRGKVRTTLLARPSSAEVGRLGVEPDGRLAEGATTLAAFDAKYKITAARTWPARDDAYQVVAAARAYKAPVAVLVYPGRFDAVWWDDLGDDDYPKHVAAIGLGLWSYRRGTGDVARGQR